MFEIIGFGLLTIVAVFLYSFCNHSESRIETLENQMESVDDDLDYIDSYVDRLHTRINDLEAKKKKIVKKNK